MKKVLAIVLTLCVVFGCLGISYASDAIELNYTPSDEIKNISVTMADDTKTERGLCWHTDIDGATAAQFVPADKFTGSFDGCQTFRGSSESFKEIYVHKVTVTSLEPGTKYAYRVGDDILNKWSDVRYFTTDDGDDSFKFIAIADVQASNEEKFIKSATVMKAAFETMPDADFYTHLGDYVNDCTQEEWDFFFEKFDFVNSQTTHVPVAGNHDGNITNKLNFFWFNNMFNTNNPYGSNVNEGTYYSFDYGNAHIAVLNTNEIYPISTQQTNWLRNDMRASDAQWKIVLMHRAAYSAGKNLIKPDTIMMREILLPLFDELNIDLVMAGHDHVYMRTEQVYGDQKVENVEYVTEMFNGVETTFALNPVGTCHILPGTAGTKTYAINDYVFDTVFSYDVVAKTFAQRDEMEGGVFSTVEIQGDKLVYNAYLVDRETGEKELVDTYAIMETFEGDISTDKERPTDDLTTNISQIFRFIYRVAEMLVNYLFVIIPKLIINAI